VLSLSVASPDVTVERYFSVSGELSAMVKQYGLAYLSETGIHPTTEPAARTGGEMPSADPSLDATLPQLTDEMLQQLLRREQELELRVAQLAQTVGPQNKDYQDATQRLQATRRVLSAATSQAVAQKQSQGVGEYYVTGRIPRVGV